MSLQHTCHGDETTLRSYPAADGTTLLASASEDKFVVLRTPNQSELADMLADWRKRHLEEVKRVFRLRPSEYVQYGKWDKDTDLPIGLHFSEFIRSDGTRELKPMFLRSSSIGAGIRRLRLDRKYPLRSDEAFLCRMARFEHDDSTALLEAVVGETAAELVDAIRQQPPEWRLWFDLGLEGELGAASSVSAFLDGVAAGCNAIYTGKRLAKNGDRPIARYFFAKWLHHHGVWLFPLHCWKRLYDGLPQVLQATYESLLLPEGAGQFYSAYVKYLDDYSTAKEKQPYVKAFRFIDHTSNFSSTPSPNPQFFEYYRDWDKEVHGSSKVFSTGVRYIWKHLHEFLEIPLSNDEVALRVAGKTKMRNLDPWSWVDDARIKTRDGLFERVVGRPEPEVQPPQIVGWAKRLRELLPRFQVQELHPITSALNEWLLYLCRLENPPLSFRDVRRYDHVNGGAGTFVEHLASRALVPAVRNRCLTVLRQAWLLDATARRASVAGCPIEKDVDLERTNVSRFGRTHRRPLPQEILNIIIEENRANDFAFSRQRTGKSGAKLDYRKVRDPESGEVCDVWCPVAATAIDFLLVVPNRKITVRFADSGEGDELVVCHQSLTYVRNPLATATSGRKEALLTLVPTGLYNEYCLGMYIAKNKSGKKYEIPYMPPECAEYIRGVVEWQKRWNPLLRPVLARDRTSDLRFANVDDVGDSYPIFRDPDNALGYPISEVRLADYFVALLRHCEPIVSEKLGQNVCFFLADGKPLIDIHTLRVTGITTLLENGVPPDVVQQLAGHACLEMTWHYYVISNSRMREQLIRGFEARKLKRSDFEQMTPDDLEWFSEYAVNTRDADDAEGMLLLRQKISAGDPFWELLPHGICPGGNCHQGGQWYRNSWHGLPRERACSLCRYRITGPAFLPGLVANANRIMWEVKTSLLRASDLQRRANEAEDRGRDPQQYLGQMAAELRNADNLLSEWFAEREYIARCEELLDQWMRDDQGQAKHRLPALLTQLGIEDVKLQLREVSDLRLLQNLSTDSEIIAGVQPPAGALEARNEILLDIAESNDLAGWLMNLPKVKRRAALEVFGDVILGSVSEDDEIETVEALRNGTTQLSDLPLLENRVEELIAEFNIVDASSLDGDRERRLVEVSRD